MTKGPANLILFSPIVTSGALISCTKHLLKAAQEEAVGHAGNVVAHHAMDGRNGQGLDVALREFLGICHIELKQLRQHACGAAPFLGERLREINEMVQELLQLPIRGLASEREASQASRTLTHRIRVSHACLGIGFYSPLT